MPVYAHSVSGRSEDEWELLEDHAKAVAGRARDFAAHFGGQDVALLLGLLHDLGKVKPRFQKKLYKNNDEPHSAEGAKLLRDRYGPVGRLLAHCIAGHHSGLPDAADLAKRLDRTCAVGLPDWLDLPSGIDPFGPVDGDASGFTVQFATRMLFSCLVDADELETAAFHASEPVRRTPHVVTEAHRRAFDRHMEGLAKAKGPIDDLRAGILSTVRERAAHAPGFFSLTVPTGGGKTLASLGFALDHALAHGMERIIHVIPFTSIVEQTAAVYSETLEAENVVEHHSSFDWDGVTDDEEQKRLWSVTRNWDAPVIVTTAVQFFESLFAARKRRCIKLHNLARSVIVIDEAQTMPRSLLRPCLAALRELTAHYGATVVLSTATQPVLTRERGLKVPEALEDVRELAPDPPSLYRALRRTRIVDAGEMDDDALIARIGEAERLLVITTTRRHARALYDATKTLPGTAHLSTAMTPAHRRHVLDEVRGRLKREEPVRVVSTSLVEAGVDVDFPLVMRAAAGLDSIAQAAGRCNRESKAKSGDVVVFTPTAEEAKTSEEAAWLADAARGIMHRHPDDPLSLAAVEDYFRHVLWQFGEEALDAAEVGERIVTKGILKEIEKTGAFAFRFDAIAKAFRMIDDGQTPVIIRGGRWGIPEKLLEDLTWREKPGGIARALQPFIVTVPYGVRRDLEMAPAVSLWREDLFGREFLLLDHEELYDEHAGLRMNRLLAVEGFF